MELRQAQADIKRAYVAGGPGVLVSAITWLAAGLVERHQGVGPAFATLFLGGMLIFPISALASRYLFHRAKESSDNPLGRLALESTVAMIAGLFAAWLFLRTSPDYVFPLAALAVGSHYAVFRTIYGDPIFWALAAALMLIGLAGIFAWVPLGGGTALAVGLVELVFAGILIARGVARPA
jgi:hypothetical protein